MVLAFSLSEQSGSGTERQRYWPNWRRKTVADQPNGGYVFNGSLPPDREEATLANAQSQSGSSEPASEKTDSLTNEDSNSVGSAEAETSQVVVEGLASGAAVTEMENQLADNDVLAAVTSMTAGTSASLEHTLDQLTTATDLFDVPALDYDGGVTDS